MTLKKLRQFTDGMYKPRSSNFENMEERTFYLVSEIIIPIILLTIWANSLHDVL